MIEVDALARVVLAEITSVQTFSAVVLAEAEVAVDTATGDLLVALDDGRMRVQPPHLFPPGGPRSEFHVGGRFVDALHLLYDEWIDRHILDPSRWRAAGPLVRA